MKSESESYNQYDKMCTSMKSEKKFQENQESCFFTLTRNAHFLRGCSDEQNTRSENRLKTDWTKPAYSLSSFTYNV